MKQVKENKEKIRKKLSSRAKKVIVLSCFCVLLLVTGGVNIYLNNIASEEANANVQTSANFFTNYRTDRQDTRNQEILYLDAIIASEATSADAKSKAEAERLALVTNMDMIMTIENLICSKGFENVVVSDMDKDGKSEVLVLWNTAGSSSGNILSVYRTDSVSSKFSEICNESCFISDVIDIDGNGRKDIFLISQNNLQGANQKIAKAMRLSGGSIALFGETKLDPNISKYISVKTEKSSDDSPMIIYVDALKGEQQMITEVVFWDKTKSELCAPLLDSETLINSLTLRYDPIESRDINNDGIIDIPVQSVSFGKGDNPLTADTENIYLTEWKSLSENGMTSIMKTIVNYQDGYMIYLDEADVKTFGIRNYRSQNCWILYSSDENGGTVTDLFSVIKVPVSKWNTDKFNAYIPVIEYEDSVVCVYIASDGKRLGIDEEFVKSKIIKIN